MESSKTQLIKALKKAWFEGRCKDFNRISGDLQRILGVSLDQINEIKEYVEIIKNR